LITQVSLISRSINVVANNLSDSHKTEHADTPENLFEPGI